MSEASSGEIEQAKAVACAFSPARLTLARQVAGKSKRQLAESIYKSAAAVTQFELGQSKPSAETLAECARVLNVPVKFFETGRPQLSIDTGDAHFRSLRATRAYQREQAVAHVALLWEIVEAIEKVVELPPVCMPGALQISRLASPVKAACELRELWQLPHGPLPHLLRHAEAHGVVVSLLPRTLTSETGVAPDHSSGTGNVDAFSTRLPHRPLVGLTGVKGGLLRRRFNVAHELGHLVLHPEARPGDSQHEREAHLFAAELLMPEEMLIDELPPKPDVAALVHLQRRWGVSVSALCFRGRVLNKYTDAQQRKFMITISKLGWRTNEPEDDRLLAGEEPALLSRALELAASAGLSVSSIAQQLALSHSVVRTLLGIPERKPRLTLIPGPQD